MDRLKRQRAARGWDLYAAGLSLACILHCLGLPLLSAILPMAVQGFDNHLMHIILVLFAVPVTLWVVWTEGIQGDKGYFAIVALAGLSLMVLAVSVHALERFEVVLTLAGGTLLGSAHVWRWFHHRARVEDNG